MESKNPTFQSYHYVLITLLTLLGCRPIEPGRVLTKFRKIVYIVHPWISLSLASTITYGMHVEVYDHRDNVMDFAEALIPAMSGIMIITKTLIYIFNRERYNRITYYLKTDLWTYKAAQDIKFRALTSVFYFLICYHVIQFMPGPVIDWYVQNKHGNATKMRPLFKRRYPYVNTNKTPGYQIMLTVDWLNTFCGISQYVGYDGLFFVLVMHTCSQFKILKESFKNIRIKAVEQLQEIKNHSTEEIKQEEYKCFAECVKRHVTLIEFCGDLQDMYGPIIFLTYATNCLLICFNSFQAIIIVNEDNINWELLLHHTMYLGAAFYQLFMWCWCGQMLIDTSIDISWAAYDHDWYNLGLNVQKSKVLVIQRAQRPMKLTALSFSTLSLESFSQILRASGSYLALLQSLLKNDDADLDMALMNE